MTAIVGFTRDNTVYIAGDSLGSSIHNKSEVKDSKVFRNKDFIFGYTGIFRFGEILEYEFVPPTQKKGVSDRSYLITVFIAELRKTLERCKYVRSGEKEGNGMFLMGYKGKLYTVQSDWSVLETKSGYSSVGSGSEYCLGAMSILVKDNKIKPEKKVKLAVKAASEHSPTVGGKVNIVKLEYKPTEEY